MALARLNAVPDRLVHDVTVLALSELYMLTLAVSLCPLFNRNRRSVKWPLCKLRQSLRVASTVKR
jgi:hypothetical protein